MASTPPPPMAASSVPYRLRSRCTLASCGPKSRCTSVGSGGLVLSVEPPLPPSSSSGSCGSVGMGTVIFGPPFIIEYKQVCHTVWPVSMARWVASSAIVDNPACRRRRCAEPGWLPPIAKGNETYTSEGAEGGSFRRVKAKNIFKGPVIWIVLAVLALLLIVPVLSGSSSSLIDTSVGIELLEEDGGNGALLDDNDHRVELTLQEDFVHDHRNLRSEER